MGQPVSHVLLQVVAHLVGFFQAGVLRHYQMKVNVPLSAGFAGAQLMEINHFPTEMFGYG